MRRTEQRQGVRMLKLRDVLTRWEAGWLSQLEAAEIVGMSERSVRRGTRRFEEEGEDGLRAGVSGVARAGRGRRTRPTRSGGSIGSATRASPPSISTSPWCGTMASAGAIGGPRPIGRAEAIWPGRRGAHRRKRPRRPLIGMMRHQDGSPHAWLVGQGPLDLVITLDDATSAIDSAGLVEEQGTASSFLGLAETIAAHGLPCSLDTDRGSPYFHTPEAGGPVAKGTLTPVGRALAQLGIEPIPASSPEARGRCERAFRPLQDRLPKELARAGMTTIAAAHAFLREVSLPAHNARFATKPAEEGSAFGLVAEAQWRDLLCIQEERTVAPDNPVSWNGRVCRSRLIRQEPLSSRPRCGSTTTRMALSPSSTDRAASFVGVPIGTQPTAALRQAAASAAFATSRPLWTAWTRLRLAQPAHKQQQTKRSTYVLHKPDIFTCALHVLVDTALPCRALALTVATTVVGQNPK